MATAARRTSDWSDKVEGTKYKKANSDIHSNIDRGFIGAKSAKLMKRAKALESRKDDAISQKESLLKNIDRPGDLKLSPLAHHAATLIDIQDMQIAYEDSNPLFSNLSFSITTGERVCLSGGNGSGKSSLLRLMAGESVPHAGHIKTASNLIISYVPQDTSALSGNMKEYAESCGVDVTLFLAILRNLGVERTQFDLPIEQGSEGQKKKVLLARSLSEKAHIYIWDEPLNYIDPISRIQIEDLLIEYKPTMLFVEHDPAFAEKISTRTISLA
jgi:lincosamide and streptogramin A transport system ATP-binding/permease protein